MKSTPGFARALSLLAHKLNPPAADVRRWTLADVGFEPAAGALRGADLRGVCLRGLAAPNIDLSGAALQGADLTGADLSGAVLRDARLRAAVAVGADFPGADLQGADCGWARFADAVFTDQLEAGALRAATAPRAAGVPASDAQPPALERLEVIGHGGHTGSVHACAFSPDGAQVLTASADRSARLWEAASRRELRRFDGHTGWVLACAFSPDGAQVLTASADGARLWETASGRCVAWLGARGSGWATWYADPRSGRCGWSADAQGLGLDAFVLVDPDDPQYRWWHPADLPEYRLA